MNRPLAQKFKARYPSLRIVEARLWIERQTTQQTIRYQGTISSLQRASLLTRQMMETRDSCGCGQTALGDLFILCKSFDSESRPGCWDLIVSTGGVPQERKRFSVMEARRLLAQISKRALATK